MSVTGPTLVRRQLGRRLRQIRKQAGKTVDDVAGSRIVSRATLHRYESGRVPVAPGKVLELGMLYGLDQATTRALYDLAIGSQKRGWWENNNHSDMTGLGFYIGLESAASVIESYQSDVLFGLLQTADYARAVEAADESAPDPDLVQERVTRRLRRQELLDRTPPVTLRLVLGAEVLARQVGGPEVMAGQFTHLRDLVRTRRIDVRVLPWERGAHAAMHGGFTLKRYDDPDDPTVVQVETAVGSAYYEFPDQVARYGRIFEAVYHQGVPLEEHLG